MRASDKVDISDKETHLGNIQLILEILLYRFVDRIEKTEISLNHLGIKSTQMNHKLMFCLHAQQFNS